MKVHKHAGMIILQSTDYRDFLFQVYDNSYRYERQRGRFNLIGGAFSDEDESPRDTALREAMEGFSSDEKTSEVGFLLSKIREQIQSSLSPHGDFLTVIPDFIYPRYYSLNSVFRSSLDPSLFREIRRFSDQGINIKDEGLAQTIDLRELKSGNHTPAWGTGLIIEDYLKKMRGVSLSLPNPDRVTIRYVGMPKERFGDYTYS